MTKTTKTTYDFDVTVEGMPPQTLAQIARGEAPVQAVQADMKPSSAKTSPVKAAPSADEAKKLSANSKSSSPATPEPAKSPAKDEAKEKEQQSNKDKDNKDKDKKKDKKNKKKTRKGSSSSSSSSSSSDSSSDDEDPRKSRGVRRALEAWRYPMYSPSASYRQVDTIAASHQYTVCGYSLARAMGCGTRLCSDLFEVAGQMFRLEVYPAGLTADNRKYMSVFLTTPGTLHPTHVLFEIAILDQSGKDKHIVATSSDCGKHHHQYGPVLTFSRGVVGAITRLVKSKHLDEKRKRYLPHDMLVLRATVHVLSGWSSIPAIHGHMTSSILRGGQSGPTAYPMGTQGSAVMGPSQAAAAMQGLAMPGFGLGPSTLHPMHMASTGPMPQMLPQPASQHPGFSSPRPAEAAPAAYASAMYGHQAQPAQQPGVVHLYPYAVPSGSLYAGVQNVGPHYNPHVPVYSTGVMPLA